MIDAGVFTYLSWFWLSCEADGLDPAMVHMRRFEASQVRLALQRASGLVAAQMVSAKPKEGERVLAKPS